MARVGGKHRTYLGLHQTEVEAAQAVNTYYLDRGMKLPNDVPLREGEGEAAEYSMLIWPDGPDYWEWRQDQREMDPDF